MTLEYAATEQHLLRVLRLHRYDNNARLCEYRAALGRNELRDQTQGNRIAHDFTHCHARSLATPAVKFDNHRTTVICSGAKFPTKQISKTSIVRRYYQLPPSSRTPE